MIAATAACRILIVDDEDAIRHFAQRVLADAGYLTTTAPDGAAALEAAAAREPFDLLLTDVNMPGMAGDELARRLRLRHPDLKVLYLTGYANRLFAARSVLWENETYVEKPVSAAGLCEAVSLALFGHTHGIARGAGNSS